MGFNDIAYELENEFGAYSSDGKYWLWIVIDKDDDLISVSCSKSKKFS